MLLLVWLWEWEAARALFDAGRADDSAGNGVFDGERRPVASCHGPRAGSLTSADPPVMAPSTARKDASRARIGVARIRPLRATPVPCDSLWRTAAFNWPRVPSANFEPSCPVASLDAIGNRFSDWAATIGVVLAGVVGGVDAQGRGDGCGAVCVVVGGWSCVGRRDRIDAARCGDDRWCAELSDRVVAASTKGWVGAKRRSWS